MPFQKTVLGEPALGVAGDMYGHNPVFYHLPTPLAGEGGVYVGRAVWLDPADATGGTVLNKGTGKPIGIVRRVIGAPIEWRDEATMLIPEGMPVTVVAVGNMVAAPTTAATLGQKVFASLTTGELSTDAAGATVAGAVETNFAVKGNAAAGETVHISYQLP